MIAYIERLLQKYDKVVFFEESFEKLNLINSNILILSTKELDIQEKQFTFMRIMEENARKLRKLYHTYEFADNFILLEQSPAFASIFNYVQTGILTLEEAWQALLGE